MSIIVAAASSAFNHQPSGNSNSNFNHRKPVNMEGVVPTSTTTTSAKPEVHSSMRNVVCYVGKKGRRIVFQSVRTLLLSFRNYMKHPRHDDILEIRVVLYCLFFILTASSATGML